MSQSLQDGQFVGAVRANRVFRGLTLAETEYRPGTVVAPHAHENALVSFVLQGSMTEERTRQRALCDAGSLVFQPGDVPHAHRFPAAARCFVLQFGAPWISRMREFGISEPGAPLDVRHTRANWLAGQLYREFQAADTAAQLAIEGFALALLGELARARERAERGARPGWLRRAVDLLHAQAWDGVQLADLAATVGVHPAHLSRTFKQHYGCTMGDYLRRIRVEGAREALALTDKPLAEIALEAGFSDQAHFSRVFKKVTGQTPGGFRKASRRS